MYLLTLAHFWALVLCLQVCQHLASSLEMFPCVVGTSKNNLVHEALEGSWDIELLTPQVFDELGPVVGTDTLRAFVSTPHKLSRNVPMCLRNLQTNIWCMRSLMEAEDIELPHYSHVFADRGLWFLVLVLCLQVCQHLPSNLEIFLCVSGAS